MFEGKKPNVQKLKAYGFESADGALSYATEVLDGQFEMKVSIFENGDISTKMTDLASGEPYALHLVDDATGAFVGAVRAEFSRVLEDIAKECFEGGAFGDEASKSILAHIKAKYGDDLEFLWEKFPQDAIVRCKDTSKWYALFVSLGREKLGLDGEGKCNIIVMRAHSDSLTSLLDGKRFLPAYHMNKKNWFTALLDEESDIPKICELIDISYELAKK